MCSVPRCATTRSTTDFGITILCIDLVSFRERTACLAGRLGRALVELVPRLFLRLEGVDRLVVERAVLLDDPANIDVLRRLAGLGIDCHRPARAWPRIALDRGHRLVAILPSARAVAH